MKIGIDISQVQYQHTGVANYLTHLVDSMLTLDKKNNYVLFFSSLRGKVPEEFRAMIANRAPIKSFRFAPSVLDLLWNRLHILPIENLLGDIDIFISSDWSQPPTKQAKKATIIYDLIVYKYPDETAKIIRTVQKRKLKWVKKECDVIFAISESTKKDIVKILQIPESKIKVIYPGITLKSELLTS